MAKATLTVRIRDADRVKLFIYELSQLRDRMRVEACPHAEHLEHLLERFTKGGDDEHSADHHP